MSSKVIGKKDRLSSMAVNAKAQLIRSRVMANDIQVLLRLVLLLKVNISIKNAFLMWIERLHKLLSERREDHTEATTRLLGIVIAFNVGLLMVLLSHDLACKKNKARSFHGDDVRESLAAFGCDMVGPLGDVLGEDGWPAGDMDVNILGVLVVAQECLSVLPAVKARNLSKLGVGNVGQRLALSVTVDGTFNVSGLDLTAVQNDGAGFINEGLHLSVNQRPDQCWSWAHLCDVKGSLVPLTISKNNKNTCLSNSSSNLVHLR
jgi:hypothetical protein